MSADHINLENIVIDNLNKDDFQQYDAFVNLADLKKNGKLIIFESYCSIVFQLVTMFMKH